MSEMLRLGMFGTWDATVVIQGLLRFETLPHPSRVADVIRQRIVPCDQFRRFVSRPCADGGLEPVTFNIGDHVESLTVQDDAELARFVEQQASVALDACRPLWRLFCITNRSGQHAILARVHHLVGDGLSLMHLFAALLTDADGRPIEFRSAKSTSPAPSSIRLSIPAVFSVLVASLRRDTATIVNTRARDLDRQRRGHRRPRLEWSPAKVVAMSPRLSLAFVKTIKAAAGPGVTVNDVLASALSGAVARYLREFDQGASAGRIRAMIPVATPRPVDQDLGNLFCLVSTELTVDESDPVERLRRMHARLARMKATNEAVVTNALQAMLSSVLPVRAQTAACAALVDAHSMFFTNVPGPQFPVYLDGCRMTAMHIPIANSRPQVSIVSYDGAYSVCVAAEPDMIAQPATFIARFTDELRDLGRSLNIEGDPILA
ncbi:WS/DGAT C-terminal domain containing protein [Plasmodiophora brassicae]|nr:hypothetical protein PBRA_005451 [Plasmodiophora brassicae]